MCGKELHTLGTPKDSQIQMQNVGKRGGWHKYGAKSIDPETSPGPSHYQATFIIWEGGATEVIPFHNGSFKLHLCAQPEII